MSDSMRTESPGPDDGLCVGREVCRGVLDNIPVGVALISPRMEVLFLNRRMRAWFPGVDLRTKPLCYRSFNYPPREAPCLDCPTIRALRDGEVHEAAMETPTLAGTVSRRVIASPAKDAAGKVAAVVELMEDITESRHAAAHLSHVNAVLRGIRNVNQLINREKDRDRLISQACGFLVEARGFHGTAIVLVGDGGRVVAKAAAGDAAPALMSMLDRGELPPCARAVLESPSAEVLRDFGPSCGGCPAAEGGHAGERGTMAVKLASGGRTYGVLIASAPAGVGTAAEEQGLFTEAADDIAFALRAIESEAGRRAAEKALRETEAQLRQAHKLDSIGRLAGGVAHDFNNLLTAIKGYAGFLLGSLDPKSPQRADVEGILNAADRGASLTLQLLAFSRKQILRPVVLDLNMTVKGMAQMLRRLIGEDIKLSTSLDPALGFVRADPGQMEQVILNLCVNARDAMPEGGKLDISTANFEPPAEFLRRHVDLKPVPHVRLAISDTGMGMDAGVMSRIFEPFFTTKELGKGTGLGLSMVYGIVKQSGGEIVVRSEPGCGSTFEIYLPREMVAVPDARPPAGDTRSLASGSETILFVEDDDRVRTLGSRILRAAGYKILEARDADEALRLLREHLGPIHLLLTDVVMPGMSGRDLARRVETQSPGMKVLYTSGYTDNIIAHHGVLDPGIELLPKPFTPEVLARRVRQVLDSD